MEEQIVFEDNHLLVINKKVGQLVQGDKTGDEPLLDSIKDFIKKRDNKPGNVFLGLVHRIDRPTSGLVIYAKTSKALSRLRIERFRIYVQAADIFTITDYSGLDPELQSFDINRSAGFGIDQGNFPHTPSYLVGVNVNF